MPETAEILAAGAVVSRNGAVLLVHRPKYDDWSFPKGKVESGEHLTATAVREVAEETGVDVRLGPPLDRQVYQVGGRTKHVHYWTARVTGDPDVSAYAANDEIDRVAWVPGDKAKDLLSYDYDRGTLAQAATVPRRSVPLLVLRHGTAFPRSEWTDDDRERPLAAEGEVQAALLGPVLEAYGVARILSSSSRRCWQTVAPYADLAGVDLEETDGLSQEDATAPSVAKAVQRLIEGEEPAVLCTHRPVLPLVFEALGVGHRKLRTGELIVVHHRQGNVVALEQHAP